MSILHVPFYPSDWLAGTRGLSAEETGVYITLIARMYEMAGPIERDDNRLHRLCGTRSKAGFVRALEHLISEGKIIDGQDGLSNERAEKEIKKVTELSAKARQAAEARWSKKPNKNNVRNNADASLGHMPQQCQLEPEPDIKKEPKGSLSSDADIRAAFDAYNETALEAGWPKAAVLNAKRRTGLRARLKDAGGLDGWLFALGKARASPLCTGNNNRGWVADLDFLLQQKSFTRLMEGSYDDRTNANSTGQSAQGRGSGPHRGLVAGFAAAANSGRQ